LSSAAYASLFLISLGAATILPFGSEPAVVGLLAGGTLPWQGIVLAASLGNVLGSIINWLLGRAFTHFQDRRWFPVSRKNMARAQGWYHRYGKASLLLSLVPIIGDPLTVAAGVLREPLWSFILLVGIAKTGRYLVLAAIALQWLQ
jgi:membrane protein YqaA with SNARE-associated domain